MREINIFDNVSIGEKETFEMDVVIWTKDQVLKNQRIREPVTITDIQMECYKPLIFTNENNQRFKCSLELKGTSPGKNVLKLMAELDQCKTVLNEIPFDDMISGDKMIQLIRKVSLKFQAPSKN